MVGYGYQGCIIDGARRFRYRIPNSSLYAFFVFPFEVSLNSYLIKHQDHLWQFAFNCVMQSTEVFIKFCLQD